VVISHEPGRFIGTDGMAGMFPSWPAAFPATETVAPATAADAEPRVSRKDGGRIPMNFAAWPSVVTSENP